MNKEVKTLGYLLKHYTDSQCYDQYVPFKWLIDDCSVDFLVRIEEITAKFRNEVTELAEDWIKGKLGEQGK